MDQPTYQRGDIVLIPFPYISDYTQSKERLAVVIQNNIANQFSPNLILALISSTVPAKDYPMHYKIITDSIIGRMSKLNDDSIIKTEFIITMPKKRVIKNIGKLPREAMEEINKCLRISLDI